jgi:glucan biosynthesis protein C
MTTNKMARPISDRRYGMDWLRVWGIYMLFPIHTAIVFTLYPFYHVRNATLSVGLLVFLSVVEPWIMPLFFVLAGWAAFYSLRSRSNRDYIRERIQKLLIPLLVGCALFGPPIKYIELKSGFNATPLSLCAPNDSLLNNFGPCLPAGPGVPQPFDESFFEFWPTFFTRFERFTWSHLWFLAYLFTLSLVFLPLFRWLMKKDWNLRRGTPAWLYAPMLPLFLNEMALRPWFPGMPNLHNDWANLAYYSICLVSGFLLARLPALEEALRREWKRALWIGLAGIIVRPLVVVDIINSPVLMKVGFVTACWGSIIALLGFADKYLARANAALAYLGESAFPVYILHQPAIVILGYWIVQLPMGIAPKYLLLLVTAFSLTLAVYHFVVRPIPILRLAFGLKPTARSADRSWPARKESPREQA